MTRVLVVDDDAGFSSAIARDLVVHSFDVTTAATFDEAVDALASAPIDVVVTDLRMGDRDGIDLLDACRSSAHPTRAILMSAYASARDYDTALQLGAVRVLCKPFTPRELIDAIQQAVECEHGFHGNVHGLSLLDILQMFHLARRNASILIGGSRPGRIDVAGGEVVDAQVGGVQGEEAFATLLSARSGSIRTTVLGEVKRTIDRPFESLVLDALRLVDETVRDSQSAIEVEDWGFMVSSRPPPMPSVSPGASSDEDWAAARSVLADARPGVSAVAFDAASQRAWVLHGELSELDARNIVDAFARALGSAPDAHCECVSDDRGVAFVRDARSGMSVLFVAAFEGRDDRGWFRSYTPGLARRILEAAPRGVAA